MKKILLAALYAAIVLSVLAMPAAADEDQAGLTVNDVEQADQVVDDVEQAGRSAVTTVPPLTVGGVGQTIPPMAVQTIPPIEAQTFAPGATLQTIPPFEGAAAVQTIPPAVRPTFPPLEVQTFAPAEVGQTIPPVAVQVNTPDIQIGVSDSSHVYVLCPDGSIQMVPAEEEQTVLRAVGKTASNLTDGQQGQYGGSLFSTEGAAGSYALTALCAFLGAAGGSALTWAVINRKRKNGKGDEKK